MNQIKQSPRKESKWEAELCDLVKANSPSKKGYSLISKSQRVNNCSKESKGMV